MKPSNGFASGSTEDATHSLIPTPLGVVMTPGRIRTVVAQADKEAAETTTLVWTPRRTTFALNQIVSARRDLIR